jgi:hypothetical protein
MIIPATSGPIYFVWTERRISELDNGCVATWWWQLVLYLYIIVISAAVFWTDDILKSYIGVWIVSCERELTRINIKLTIVV